jgi:hypothetical protein
MKGYKVFDADWKCRGFKYEIGKTYKHDGDIRLCEAGFHFCERLQDCFSYYAFDPKNKVAEVESIGKIINGGDKSVTNEMKVIKSLTWEDVLKIANIGKLNTGHSNSGESNSGYWNSGDRNSGYWNSGYWNSGDRNSGYWNSGDRNSGHRNSGGWNSANNEAGFFNSEQSDYIRVFNKKCMRLEWEKAEKPHFIYFDLTQWIDSDDMTDDEKRENPNAKTCGGYLRILDYKKAFQKSYEKASKEDIELLKSLPNFDADVFYEISGIKIG